nr:MAG TPA: D Insect pheromone-binding family, A10/OS-D [Caudoviricetes sp.]
MSQKKKLIVNSSDESLVQTFFNCFFDKQN